MSYVCPLCGGSALETTVTAAVDPNTGEQTGEPSAPYAAAWTDCLVCRHAAPLSAFFDGTEAEAAEVEAIDYYRRSIPSLLPDQNPHKAALEEHRWSKHAEWNGGPFPSRCLACSRGLV